MLLSAVYADPDADQPRYALAEWLVSHGDEWGEFISLQLRRASDARPSQRESAVLRSNMARICGPLLLYSRPESRQFERGFLSSMVLRRTLLSTEIAPEWATLRQLTAFPDVITPGFFQHPALRWLRVAHNVPGVDAVALDQLSSPRPLEHLSALASLDRLGLGPGLTNVRHLTVTNRQIESCWRSPLVPRLDRS